MDNIFHWYKINGIINKFLLIGDKFKHLRQSRFPYSTCWIFTKDKEEIQETGDSRFAYQNKIDKACLKHDIAYGDFEDLPRRAAVKCYMMKQLILLKIQNMMDIKEV